MKANLVLKSLILLVVLSYTPVIADAGPATQNDQAKNVQVKIECNESLYGLAASWADSYRKLKTDADITVVKQENSDVVNDGVLFLNLVDKGKESHYEWEMAIGKDAVVPVYNTRNPGSEVLAASGIKLSVLTALLNQENKQKWADILPEGDDRAIEIYFDKSIADSYKTSDNEAAVVYTESQDDLFNKVLNNNSSIGFIRLSSLTGNEKLSLPAGLAFLPVDKNANGRIDPFEDIYSSTEELVRGIWIGKYPQQLCNRIILASSQKPADEGMLEFLAWVLNSGNEIMAVNGYSPVPDFVKKSELALLTGPATGGLSNSKPIFKSGLTILFSVIVAAALIAAVIIRARKKKPAQEEVKPEIATALNPSLITSPQGLFFDKSHTWAFMEMNGYVRVGLDDFIQHITGEITSVRFIKPGNFVRRGETLVTIIQDGKHLEVKSPVTGLIRSLNNDLESDSTLINKSPYGSGWVCMIEPGNWKRETEFMFMATRFREWLGSEFNRLRDFFAYAMKESDLVYNRIALQDGGEIRDKVLSEFGPEVWEDFQVKFIDSSK